MNYNDPNHPNTSRYQSIGPRRRFRLGNGTKVTLAIVVCAVLIAILTFGVSRRDAISKAKKSTRDLCSQHGVPSAKCETVIARDLVRCYDRAQAAKDHGLRDADGFFDVCIREKLRLAPPGTESTRRPPPTRRLPPSTRPNPGEAKDNVDTDNEGANGSGRANQNEPIDDAR